MSNEYISLGGAHQVPKKKRKLTTKLIIIGFFMVLIIIAYTTFFESPKLSGMAIFNKNNINNTKIVENGIKISADLTIPELKTKGRFKEISLVSSPKSSFYISNEKVETPETGRSTVLLKNFNGEVLVNKDNLEIDGRTEKIFTEKIPISSKSQDSVRVKFDEDFNYLSFEIKDDFFIKRLIYETSGTLKIDEGTSIVLTKDKINLEGFVGTIKIENGKMNLNGKTSSIEIEGEKKISISN